VDKLGRYAHVSCLQNPPSGNFFTRLFSRWWWSISQIIWMCLLVTKLLLKFCVYFYRNRNSFYIPKQTSRLFGILLNKRQKWMYTFLV
jgi:type II secretory pathway component PulF